MTDEQKAKKAEYMRAYRAANPEYFKELDRVLAARKKARNPEKFKASGRERQKKYRARKKAKGTTPEETERQRQLSRERNARYRDKDRERYRKIGREKAKKLYALNPEKYLSVQHRRRSVIDAGTVTTEEWAAILERFDHRCAYCGAQPKKLERDHVVPLSKGGLHVASNLVPSCRGCNVRKSNKLLPNPPMPQHSNGCFTE